MSNRRQHTTREKRRKRPVKATEIVTILGALAGLVTALAHLIQALK